MNQKYSFLKNDKKVIENFTRCNYIKKLIKPKTVEGFGFYRIVEHSLIGADSQMEEG